MNMYKCIKLLKKDLEKKIVFDTGIPLDIFDALKHLYSNVDFNEINASSTNNLSPKLAFTEDEIVFNNYIHRRFKSNDTNPKFNINQIRLNIKSSDWIHYKSSNYSSHTLSIIILLFVKVSKKSKIRVRYQIPITYNTYRDVHRFIMICKLYNQYKNNIMKETNLN